MVFTGTIFLFVFLPFAVVAFYLFPARWRVAPLLVTSAIFYAWGEPVLVGLILLTALFTFSWGRLILAADNVQLRKRRLIIGIIVVLVPMVVFKYLDFGLITVGLGGVADRTHLRLPIGLSFYTFMALGYLIDLYRRLHTGASSLLTFSGFLTMFPHLVAGPIVRWHDIGFQLRAPRFDPGLFGYGALRVASGLFKKAVLADSLAVVVDSMYATGAPASTGAAWVAAFLYSLQIYLDFSAYSDIAVGLAAMLGVRFHENFRFPYRARSAREFWQRWHISLGSWFRDYLYVPLGGSRVRPALLWRNLLIVWAVTGLWHGAAWTFVMWGLYYGVVIGLERSVYGDRLARLAPPFQHCYGLVIAVFGWVIFRSTSLQQVGEYYRAMLGLGDQPGWNATATFALRQTWVLVGVGILLAAGAARPFMDRVEHSMAGVWEGNGVTVPLDTATQPSSSFTAAPADTAPAMTTPSAAARTSDLGHQQMLELKSEPGPVEPGLPVRSGARTAGPGLVLMVSVVASVLLLVATAFMVSVTYSPFIYFRF